MTGPAWSGGGPETICILGGFVDINRPHLAVDRIQLSLKLVLLIENRRTGTVEALTVDVGQLQPRDCRPDR